VQRVNRNVTSRKTKPASLGKASNSSEKSVKVHPHCWGLGGRGKGIAQLSSFTPPLRPPALHGQQLLPWSLGCCLPPGNTSITPDIQLLQKYPTISRCLLIVYLFPHSCSNATSHYHLSALFHQASTCSLQLSFFIFPGFLLFPTSLSDAIVIKAPACESLCRTCPCLWLQGVGRCMLDKVTLLQEAGVFPAGVFSAGTSGKVRT